MRRPIGRTTILRFAKENGFKVLNSRLSSGDSYLAGRNTKIELLTCDKIFYPGSGNKPWVLPTEGAYCYDLDKCVKVELKEK